MKKNYRKIIIFTVVVFLLIGAFPVSAIAVSQNYASKLTDIANKYVGKTNSGYFHFKDAWCAQFVQRCAQDAGLVSGNLFPKINATGASRSIKVVRGMADWFTENKKGTYYHFGYLRGKKADNNTKRAPSNFTPKAGDLVCFYWTSDGDNLMGHIGIVTKYDTKSKKITVVDGNSGEGNFNKVLSRQFSANWSQICGYVRPNYTQKSVSPTIKYTNIKFPKSFIQGTDPAIQGTVTSVNATLTSVAASVKNNTGIQVMSKTVNLTGSKYNLNLNKSAIDTALKFNTLSPGEYTLTFTSKAGSKTLTSGKFIFTVLPKVNTPKPAVTITFTDIKAPGTYIPGVIKQDLGGHIVGTVKSTGAPISKVTATVKDTSNKIVMAKSVNINSYTYALKDSNLDRALPFGSLPYGDYTLEFTAEAGGASSYSSKYIFKVHSKNKKYMVMKGAASWADAQKKCAAKGGHLATLTTREENLGIYNELSKNGLKDVYFGLVRIGGTWKWVTGEPINYTNWSPGEPNNDGGIEECAMFYSKSQAAKWNDGHMTKDSYFLCEID